MLPKPQVFVLILAAAAAAGHGASASEMHVSAASDSNPASFSLGAGTSESVTFSTKIQEEGDLVVDLSGTVTVDSKVDMKVTTTATATIKYKETKLMVLDFTASFSAAVCDLLRAEVGLSSSISFPGFTTGNECGDVATCASCFASPKLKDLGPFLACEDSSMKKFFLDLDFEAKLKSKEMDFGKLEFDMCKIAADAKDSAVVDVCDYTGSDIKLRIDQTKLRSTWTGIEVPLELDITLLNPDGATKGPMDSTLAKEGLDAILDVGGFTKGAVFKKTYNIAAEVAKGLGSKKTPSWIKNNYFTIGSVGPVCADKPAPFGVELGLPLSQAKANLAAIQTQIAAAIKSEGTDNPPVEAYQLQKAKIAASQDACSPSTTSMRALPASSLVADQDTADATCWFCGDMHGGAGRDSGALNTILAHAVAKGETIKVGAKQIPLEKMASHTTYTCSKDAKENGGCVTSPSPSGGGSGSGSGSGSGAGSGSSVGPDSDNASSRVAIGLLVVTVTTVSAIGWM